MIEFSAIKLQAFVPGVEGSPSSATLHVLTELKYTARKTPQRNFSICTLRLQK